MKDDEASRRKPGRFFFAERVERSGGAEKARGAIAQRGRLLRLRGLRLRLHDDFAPREWIESLGEGFTRCEAKRGVFHKTFGDDFVEGGGHGGICARWRKRR